MKLTTFLLAGLFTLGAGFAPAGRAADAAAALPTRTPIKHLIVIVGENVTFDTLFGTYSPMPGASIRNLRSQGIVNADGTPGINYNRAVQYEARNLRGQYTVEPIQISPYSRLPQPTLIGAFNPLTLAPFGAIPDWRFATLDTSGPFQITTPAPLGAPYGDPRGFGTDDPVHRFFQMWQQTGGTSANLKNFAWVALTVGKVAIPTV